jgi:copper(I)-binding protein
MPPEAGTATRVIRTDRSRLTKEKHMRTNHRTIAAGAAALLALSLALAGCSSDEESAQEITVSDAFVKSASMEPMDMGSMDMEGSSEMKDSNASKDDMAGMDDMEPMSAAFMLITNGTDQDVRLVGGTTAAADRIEIHEVVDGVMQEIDGGLAIPAGSTSTLEPGGNHVMLMGLTQDLEAGDEVALTLRFDDGEEIVVTAPVKDVAAGDEPYATSTPKA